MKYKARWCARGDLQEKDSRDAYAGTVRVSSLRLMYSISSSGTWLHAVCDVTAAYLQTPMPDDKPVYMHQPQMFNDHSNRILKLLLNLWGTRMAARNWQKDLVAFLESIGFKATPLDAHLHTYRGPLGTIFVCTHVDDLPHIGSTPAVMKWFADTISAKWQVTFGDPEWALGIRVRKLPNNDVVMDQASYIEKLAHRFKIEESSKLPSTPLVTGVETIPQEHLAANGTDRKKIVKSENVPSSDVVMLSAEKQALYQSLIGSLLYLDGTRPDMTFAVHYLARKMRAPCEADLQQAYRALGYALRTKHLGLTYRGSSMPKGESNVLYAYSDASYAPNGDGLHKRKSTTGYALMMNGAAVSWTSKLQKSSAGSTVHAEVAAMYACMTDAMGTRSILNFMGYKQSEPCPLFEDSGGAQALVYNG